MNLVNKYYKYKIRQDYMDFVIAISEKIKIVSNLQSRIDNRQDKHNNIKQYIKMVGDGKH